MKANEFSRSPSFVRWIALIGMLFALIAGVTNVSAQENDQPVELSVKPIGVEGSYFDLTLKPGETQQLVVELGNHGVAPVQARSYAADVYTIVNGGFGAKLDGEPMSGATQWIDYPTATFELAPGMANVRTFTVTVPRDAQPGDHITSIAIQNAVATGGDGEGVVVKQINRQVVAIAIRVPGDHAPALGVGAVTYSDVGTMSVIAVDVQNTGNVRLTPTAGLVLSDAAGSEVQRATIQMDSFYAGTQTKVEFAFPERLAAGDYTATLELLDAGTGARASTPNALGVTVPQTEETIIVPPAGTTNTVPVAQAAPVTVSAQSWKLVVAAVAATLAVVGFLSGVILLVRKRVTRARRSAEWRTVAAPVSIEPVPVLVTPVVVRQLVPSPRASAHHASRLPRFSPIHPR